MIKFTCSLRMILFLAAAAFFSLVGCVCDDPGDADYADVCYKIFGEFEKQRQLCQEQHQRASILYRCRQQYISYTQQF